MHTVGIYFGKDVDIKYIVRKTDEKGNLIYEKEFNNLEDAINMWQNDGSIVLSINGGALVVPLIQDDWYPYIIRMDEQIAKKFCESLKQVRG